MKGLALGIICAMAIMALPASVRADPVVLDFTTGVAGPGGTLTISGGTVTGKNILIDALTVSNDGSYDGVYNVDGTGKSGQAAVLNFTAGPGGISGSIVGNIPTLGIASNVTLMSGAFTSWSWDAAHQVFHGFGNDTLDSGLMSALGLTWGTTFDFELYTSGANHTVSSTDLRTESSVPDPASTGVLLAMVLVGLVASKAFGAASDIRAERRSVNGRDRWSGRCDPQSS
jgi:hypothetical protein